MSKGTGFDHAGGGPAYPLAVIRARATTLRLWKAGRVAANPSQTVPFVALRPADNRPGFERLGSGFR